MLMQDLEQIGSKMYEARKKIGLTQSEVAESASVSDRTYADIERGKVNMRIGTFIQICNALHVRPDEVLTDDSFTMIDNRAELLERLDVCSTREQKIILNILSVYLNSINR